MSFLEPGGKVSVVKDGKTVEEIDIETEVTLINTKTNQKENYFKIDFSFTKSTNLINVDNFSSGISL